jgi:hypothetical protein
MFCPPPPPLTLSMAKPTRGPQRFRQPVVHGLQGRVRRHFRFEAKWSETEAKFFSLRCEKKWFSRLFRIDAKRRNLKRNEKEAKRKRNEKEAKLPSFSLRSKMKRNGSEIFFASMQRKCMKIKWSEKKTKKAKTSKRKRIKWNSRTICKETKKNIKVCLSVFQVYT